MATDFALYKTRDKFPITSRNRSTVDGRVAVRCS